MMISLTIRKKSFPTIHRAEISLLSLRELSTKILLLWLVVFKTVIHHSLSIVSAEQEQFVGILRNRLYCHMHKKFVVKKLESRYPSEAPIAAAV